MSIKALALGLTIGAVGFGLSASPAQAHSGGHHGGITFGISLDSGHHYRDKVHRYHRAKRYSHGHRLHRHDRYCYGND